MAMGPGKYDKLATWARQRVGANAIVLIVIGGDKGHGSSVQVNGAFRPDDMKALAHAMRMLADEIEVDAEKLRS